MEIYARDLLAMDLILAKYPADARAVLRKIVKWIALTLWQGNVFWFVDTLWAGKTWPSG